MSVGIDFRKGRGSGFSAWMMEIHSFCGTKWNEKVVIVPLAQKKINDPAFYFKDDSLSTLIALDNLMLTHGYREFTWKEIHFQPESSIEIKGQVISSGLGKPVVNGKVTMMTLKSLLGVYEQETDSLRQFVFSNLYFYDTIYTAIKALNQRGKNVTSIIIDSSSWTSPKSKLLPYPIDYYGNESIQSLDSMRETKNDLINKKWTLSDTILFDDVYVLAPKKEKDDGHPRIYFKQITYLTWRNKMMC